MPHVITQYERPSPELIEEFKGLSASTVYEAAGRQGSIDPAIKPLSQTMRLLGPAVTVRCHPKDNLMLHKALQVARPGDIIMASTDGYYNAGYFGELMAISARALRISGLAIDGCVRDGSEIISMGFPVFCRGTCMRGTSKGNLGLINHPTLFGDVLVHPGDLVIGDSDGIVAIPKDQISSVLEGSRKRVEKEKNKAASLSKGITSIEYDRLDKVLESLGLIED